MMKETILVVGDDLIAKTELQTKLADTYEVRIAKDSKEAISALQTTEGTIDTVLLSMVLPQIDGYRVLHYMKGASKPKETKVIAVTGQETYQAHLHEFAGILDQTVGEGESAEQILTAVSTF